MTSRTRWDDSSFDVVLDKAMLDALLTSKLAASATAAGGTSGDSKPSAVPGPGVHSALNGQATNGDGPARAGDGTARQHGFAWSDMSSGDISAARGYLAEVHRLLVPGECSHAPIVFEKAAAVL